MMTFESDDLLIRSQMLISKFRKQREVALNQQTTYVNKSINLKPIQAQNNNLTYNKSNTDCDSYPQRERDNVLLTSFTGQHYFTPSLNTKQSKIKISNHRIAKNVELSSSSEGSIWSASSPTDRGLENDCFKMMTDPVSGIPMVDDDIMTPITALPLTHRPLPDVNNKVDEVVSSSRSKRFTSIGTQFQMSDLNQAERPRIIEKVKENDRSNDNTCRAKTDYYANLSTEEDRMNVAWEYFQEEKVLEKRIVEQTDVVERLKEEMSELILRIEKESQNLIEMKNEKEEFRSRRYGIFNGLSREIYANVTEREREMLTYNREDTSNERFQNESLERCVDGNEGPQFDSNTVRNIVNRIVCKEFNNSEDRIFDNVIKNPIQIYDEDQIKHLDTKDDCVLSDVLSAKDLKIAPSVNSTGSNGITMTSSMSCFNNSAKSRGAKPPKIKKKLRPAHSADNINQMVHSSFVNPRRNVHSPSVSLTVKQLLYSSSSSEESVLESRIHSRR